MNAATPRYQRVRERQYSAHHQLLDIARLNLNVAKQKEPGWFNAAFVTITFSALALEAIANAFGQHLVPDWKDFESASPTAKLRLLAERLSLPYAKTDEPWATVIWLSKFRNLVAHPKPERVVEKKLVSPEQAKERPWDPPESKLESQITIGNADRAVKMVDLLRNHLAQNLSPEDRFDLDLGGWSTTTELHSPSADKA